MKETEYHIAIAGGGLAGLSLAIQSARAGYKTILFEKERYPFHRVCGEYISLESWNFLQELGIPLSDMHLPQIQQLIVSAPDGTFVEHKLPLGGFGISRHLLDNLLAKIAIDEGVDLKENCRVEDITYSKDHFQIQTKSTEWQAKVVAGAFGKRSNLDIKWKRGFIKRRPNKLNHYIGVKYHVRYNHPPEQIALHNFEDGYCGISKVENDISCLCYLTTAANLKKCNGDIRIMEEQIVKRNPLLKKIFDEAEFIYDEPLTISQISFNRKNQVDNHVLMIGDSAGLITPLCGNGMSMALHASKLAFHEIEHFLAGRLTRFEMETQYSQQWEKYFGSRLQAGRIIQQFFGGVRQSKFLISAVKPFPRFLNFLIRQTHGQPY